MFLDEALPHPGQAQVRELDQVERIDRDLRVREAGGDRLLERCRRVDRHDGDAVPPRLAAGVQPAFDGGTVAAFDDPEHLPGGHVDYGGHPRLDSPPPVGVGVAEPADPSVAVLIDPQVAHVQVVDVRQYVDGGVDGLLGSPPGDPEPGCDTGDGPAVVDDCLQHAPP